MYKLFFVIALFLGVVLLGCITTEPVGTSNQVAPSEEQGADQSPSSSDAGAGQSESDEDSSSQGPTPSSTPPSFPE